jgi:flavin reductase (DIM6/NTAB) family NADH-FMN oxidoreductase RutF
MGVPQASIFSRDFNMDQAAIGTVFAQLDRELWLVTARARSRRGGLIATFVNPASIVPGLPRVIAGLARRHFTHELIEASGAFALHLLGEEHLDWVWRFGLQTGRGRDKLAGLALGERVTGSPILTDAPGWLDCQVEGRLDTGDRTLYLAEVVAGEMVHLRSVLTFQRLLQLAPADKLRQLKKALVHDSMIDAAAIQAWRLVRSPREPLPRPPDARGYETPTK